MACLLSSREVEALENESDDFARSRRQRGRPPARGDNSETDVLPKGYLFVLLLVVLFAGVLPASFVLWACLSIFFISTCHRLSDLEQRQRVRRRQRRRQRRRATRGGGGGGGEQNNDEDDTDDNDDADDDDDADSDVERSGGGDIESALPTAPPLQQPALLRRGDDRPSSSSAAAAATTTTTANPLAAQPPPPSAAAAELLRAHHHLALDMNRELTPQDHEALLALDASSAPAAAAPQPLSPRPLRPNTLGAELLLLGDGAAASARRPALARPVSETDLARLPTHIYQQEGWRQPQPKDDDDHHHHHHHHHAARPSCPVCLCAFCDGDAVTTLPCLHLYHRACIEPWLRQGAERADCPVCKTAVWE